jgi:predicted dehydrogenase
MVQKQSRPLKRRDFLAGVTTLPLLGAGDHLVSDESLTGDNATDHREETLRLGLVGFGKRGEELCHEVLHSGQNTEIIAVCEVCNERLETGVAAAGTRATAHVNYQELLDNKHIDAVIIATPDHWHARMAMDAAGRGKHIYLEAPMTRTAEEAKALKEAVRSSGVIFQLGHQGRQRDLNLKARELLAGSILGQITLIEATTNRNDPEGGWQSGKSGGALSENIAWELFQGPAAGNRPFTPERYHYWRNYWDYGNGMSGIPLCNEFDAVNSIMDLGIPESAIATGGLYYHRDGREVPDVFQAAFEYPDKELCLLYSGTLANGIPRGTLFMGRDASLELGRILSVWVEEKSLKYKSRIQAGIIDPSAPFVNYMQDQNRVDGISSATSKYYADRGLVSTYREGKEVSTTRLHLAEWLNAIRGKRECSCNIDRGFEVAVAAHMATLSYREGRKMKWDPETETIH